MNASARLGEVITLGESDAVLAGHLESVVGVDGGIRPVRIPSRHSVKLPPGSGFVRSVMAQGSGVRLMISTASQRIALRVRCTRTRLDDYLMPANSFVATVAGRVVGVVDAPVDRVETWTLGSDDAVAEVLSNSTVIEFEGLPGGEKDVTIWLPQALVTDLLSLAGDAPISPSIGSSKPVWLHYGSSISHCVDADRPTSVWPVVAAQLAGLEVVNLGFAGNCMLDPFVADAIAETSADVISIKVGVNMVGARAMDQRTFIPALHGFLDRVRSGHPDVPVILASSILWPGSEDVPGPSTVDLLPDGGIRCRTAGAVGDIAMGALTLAASRDHVRHVVEMRAAAGEDICYLDGRLLYGEGDVAGSPLPDGLHPSAPIYEEMGRRFSQLAFGATGLIPRTSLAGSTEATS